MIKIKKIKIIVFLIMMIITVNIFSIPEVSAKTVGDLKGELNALEKEAKDNKNKIIYTDNQIKKAKQDIIKINKDIDRMANEIIAKNKEIESLNIEIKEKDNEVKELIEFAQLSSNSLLHAEYIMGSESLTDFIYRVSVTEQLTEYNNKLINDMNNMIKVNEERKIELNKQTKQLENKQVELSSNVKILANERVKLDEYDRSIEDEIKVAREVLQMYINAGCKDLEDINVCANKILPEDTGFLKPMQYGYVTSEFSMSRINPITGVAAPHAAIDVSSSNKSINLYPVANGKVANVFYDNCAGRTVVIHHRIKEGSIYKNYSSTYAHLETVNVKIGTAVFRNTVIGTMGSSGYCSTGPHLHLAISRGHRYKDYVSYSAFVANSINPRMVINFPSYRVTWYNR